MRTLYPGYTKMAFQAGATKEELVEFLNVAMAETGCPGEQWVLIALEVFQQLESGKPVNADICCHNEAAN